MALSDRVGMPIDRASFDDLVTLVTQAPPWEKDRVQGVRILLRAIGEGQPDAPDQILARWTWKLARAVRKVLDRKASAEFPEAKRLLGALANSRGHRHEENAAKLAAAAKELPIATAAALLASAEGYTPRANHTLEAAREELGHDRRGRERAGRRPARTEGALGRRRRRRRRKKKPTGAAQQGGRQQQSPNGSEKQSDAPVTTEPASATE